MTVAKANQARSPLLVNMHIAGRREGKPITPATIQRGCHSRANPPRPASFPLIGRRKAGITLGTVREGAK
jgi:hypothetical protein